MNRFVRLWLALIATALSISAFARNGESIVFNPATGNYRITYREDDGTFRQLNFIPATKISPTLKSEVKLEQHGKIRYEYTLSSGPDGKQDIDRLVLEPVSSVAAPGQDFPFRPGPAQPPHPQEDPTELHKILVGGQSKMEDPLTTEARHFDKPPLWDANMMYSREVNGSLWIIWIVKHVTNGLHPGERAVFGFSSHDLPGIILAEIHALAPGSETIGPEEQPMPWYDKDGLHFPDDEFDRQYINLVVMQDFVPRPVAVPTLTVTQPFDAVSVITQLKDHIAKWQDMTMLDNPTWPHIRLIDTATANAVISGLQTALYQLSIENKEAAARALKSTRAQLDQLLADDAPDNDKKMTIDKGGAGKIKKDDIAEQAAANRQLVKDVLQFDLTYIALALSTDGKMGEEEKR